jgi:hypothetical protein
VTAPKGIGPKNRITEPVTGAAAIAIAATALTNKDYPAAVGYFVLAVIPWVTSWLTDRVRAKP